MDRKNIRQKVKEMLLGNTSAEDRVFSSRSIGISSEEELPCINIATDFESSQNRGLNDARIAGSIRKMILKIEARISEINDCDDALDDFIEEIEDVLIEDLSFSGTCLSAKLLETELKIDIEGKVPCGLGIITYECTYTKEEG